MALIAKFTTLSGVLTNYHKVANLSHNTDNNTFSGVLYSYVNQKLKDKGSIPAFVQAIQIYYSEENGQNITNIQLGNNNYKFTQFINIIDFTRANLYSLLKLLPEFQKATDDNITFSPVTTDEIS